MSPEQFLLSLGRDIHAVEVEAEIERERTEAEREH